MNIEQYKKDYEYVYKIYSDLKQQVKALKDERANITKTHQSTIRTLEAMNMLSELEINYLKQKVKESESKDKLKTCKDCKTPKQLTEFPKNGNSFRSRCKICHSDYKKALKNDKVLKDKAIRINKIKIALGGGR